MNLQVSLPFNHMCMYNCRFCCNTTHSQFNGNILSPLNFADEVRMRAHQGIYDAIVLTGENEPLQNLQYVVAILLKLPDEVQVEMTLRGYKLDQLMDEYPKLMHKFSLINFSVVNDGQPSNPHAYLTQIRQAKRLRDEFGVKIRFTFLLTTFLSPHQVKEVIKLGVADEITLKELQGSTPWINKNKSMNAYHFLCKNKPIHRVSDRFYVITVDGQAVWVDRDCQQDDTDNYVILRPDGKLYHKWTDKIPLGGE